MLFASKRKPRESMLWIVGIFLIIVIVLVAVVVKGGSGVWIVSSGGGCDPINYCVSP